VIGFDNLQIAGVELFILCQQQVRTVCCGPEGGQATALLAVMMFCSRVKAPGSAVY